MVKGAIMLKFKADLTDEYLEVIEDLKNDQIDDIQVELLKLDDEILRTLKIVSRASKNIIYTSFDEMNGLEILSSNQSPKSAESNLV